MLEESGCKVVICGDRNCKLCTATTPNEASVSAGQAYVVYTCESPNCSLCREETDVLLDLFCPFNSIQDIREMSRNIINTTGTQDGMETEEIETETWTDLGTFPSAACYAGESANYNTTSSTTTRNDGSAMLRQLLQSNPGSVNIKSKNPDLDITQNLKKIDERCLMDLAHELQVDQLDDLPELTDEGISDFV